MKKRDFFEVHNGQGLALTYDDVRMETGPSNISAPEIEITSNFSRNVELKVPLVSAAMDTVTESTMAIAMAKLGGLGVIHSALSVEDQKHEVRRVKLHLNGLIERPVTVKQSERVSDVLEMCDRRGFDFRTFPVVDKDNQFVGLLTQNDFDFCSDNSRKVSGIMTPRDEVIFAPADTSMDKAHKIIRKHKKKTLPLLNLDGTIAGMYILSDVKRATSTDASKYNLDEDGRLRVAAAVPTDDEALERVDAMHPYVDVVVVDSARGDTKFAIGTLKRIKDAFPDLDVVVGNISSPKSARLLAKAGADGIKIGQGPGSICTTRVKAGVGTPQVTAVYNCSQIAKRYGIPVCADGGVTQPGDIPIAIAAGASTVMMGGRFAGTRETPGDVLTLQDGSKVKLYRGMGSASALRDNVSSRKRYDVGTSIFTEGIEAYVSYAGIEVREVVEEYEQALRRGMEYVGAKNIRRHQEKTRFIRITSAGLRESHPHDVTVVASKS